MRTFEDYLARTNVNKKPDPEPEPDRNIYVDGRAPAIDQKAILDFVGKGTGWRDAALRLRDQQEAERAERKRQRSLELQETPPAEFDRFEEDWY